MREMTGTGLQVWFQISDFRLISRNEFGWKFISLVRAGPKMIRLLFIHIYTHTAQQSFPSCMHMHALQTWLTNIIKAIEANLKKKTFIFEKLSLMFWNLIHTLSNRFPG
jgi:hypothetical protein